MAGQQIDALMLASLATAFSAAGSDVRRLNAQEDLTLADAMDAGERLTLAANGLRKLFKELDPADKGQVGAFFDKVGDEAEGLRDAKSPADARVAMGKILKLVTIQEAVGESPNSLQSLLRNISTSLIEAQKELNRSSLEYGSSLDPRLPPTVYGIPSVKAEMKVGFNQVTQNGVNLFLFTKSSLRQQYAESTVNFEVVGTPPPPGPAAYGDYVVPIPRLLVIGKTREALLDQIIAEKKVRGVTYENTRDKAIVLRYERGEKESVNKYLVLWAAQRANQSDPQWDKISIIYALGHVTSGGNREIFEFPNDSKDNTIFEYPPPNRVLLLPPAIPAKLEPFVADVPEFVDPPDKPEIKMAKLSIDLGDVVMNLALIVNDWLDAVKYKLPPSGE